MDDYYDDIADEAEEVEENEDVGDENEENENDEKALEAVIKKTEDLAKKRKKAASGKLRPRLTERELMDEKKGLRVLKESFVGYKPISKHPYENLKDVMKKVEYWGHNLFPKSNFSDFITRIEQLGKKRAVKVYMTKLRLGLTADDEFVKDDDEEKPEDNLKTASSTRSTPINDDDFYDDFPFTGTGTPVDKTAKPKLDDSDNESLVTPIKPKEKADDEIVYKKKVTLSTTRAILSDSEDEDLVAGPSKKTENDPQNKEIEAMNEDEIMDYLFSTD